MNSSKKYVKFFSKGYYFPLYISPLILNIQLRVNLVMVQGKTLVQHSSIDEGTIPFKEQIHFLIRSTTH